MAENTYSTSNNRTLVATSSAGDGAPVNLWADPSTHGLVVSATISSVGIATSTNQTNGTQLTQITDGSGHQVTVTGGKLDVNATASLAGTALPISSATTAVGVAIVDGSGNQITSFGGGTQYADGAARGTATGTISMVDDGTLIQSQKGDSDGTAQSNTTKLAGTAIDVNSGNKSAGTQRIVIATDQPQLTNALKVDGSAVTQPVSLATNTPTLQAGSTTTVTQATGTNLHAVLDAGSAVIGKVSIDQTTPGTTNLVALAANQSVNNAQINGVTPLMGNGVTGTGSQRVTIASDNTAFNVIADTEMASAVAVGDGIATTTTAPVVSYGVIFNGGTTFDRIRGGQGDGAGSTGLQDIVPRLYNGTTYDRWKGDATNGAFVNIKSSVSLVTTNATTSVVGNGVAATAQRVTLANDSTGIIATVGAVTAITNALPAGSNVIGHVITDSGSTTAVTGTVATAEVAPATVLNGKTTVTTAGTRVVLASSTTAKSVTIKALAANTGIIYVGSSTVASTNGFQLAAGDSISLDISNLNTVNIDSSVNGEGVSYLGVN